MKRYSYLEPGDHGETVKVVVTLTAIMDTYFPWWKEQMAKVGKASQISEQACLEDWITVHWAQEEPE